MLGVVNQAVIELENKIESPIPVPHAAPNPTTDESNNIHDWYNKPLGIIAIGTVIIILGAIAIWVIKQYFSVKL